MANEILTPAQHYITFSNLPTDFIIAAQMTSAVSAALTRFDDDHARVINGAITGDGTNAYDLSTDLASWDEDSSSVTGVEYPYTLGEDNELKLTDWSIEDDPTTGMTLCFPSHTPAATETIKVTFVAPWTEATVPSKYIQAVAKLAASNMALMIASRMAQSNESTIGADTFRHNSAARDWRDIAKDLEIQYKELLGLIAGIAASSPKPASVDMQIDVGSGSGYGKVHDYADD